MRWIPAAIQRLRHAALNRRWSAYPTFLMLKWNIWPCLFKAEAPGPECLNNQTETFKPWLFPFGLVARVTAGGARSTRCPHTPADPHLTDDTSVFHIIDSSLSFLPLCCDSTWVNRPWINNRRPAGVSTLLLLYKTNPEALCNKRTGENKYDGLRMTLLWNLLRDGNDVELPNIWSVVRVREESEGERRVEKRR